MNLLKKILLEKRDNKLDLLFKDLEELINNYKYLFNVSGKNHLLNCDKSISKYSKFTIENCASYLKYIFVLLLKEIGEVNNKFNKKILELKSLKNVANNELEIEENTNIEADDLEISIEDNIKSIEESKTEGEKYMIELLQEILIIINKNQEFYDKHTKKYIKEVIDKVMDEEKEANLKFIEELDKESRQSLKSMLTVGYDSWKKLNTKEDKNLYFGDEQLPQSDTIGLTETEIEENNRLQAQQQLGNNYTDEEYQQFIENRDNNMREEQQIQADMDVMRDDDGDDDMGPEAEDEY